MLYRVKNCSKGHLLIKNHKSIRKSNCSLPKRLSSNLKNEYWQRSEIPTHHFQKSLTSLPIPALEDTCRRYLHALEPLLTPQSFQEASTVVRDFSRQEGPRLQSSLLSYNKTLKHTSYIADIWFNGYWSDRRPLVLNFNPYLVFNNHPNPLHMQQAVRATNLIVSTLRFRRSLLENVLEPDVYYVKSAVANDARFKKIVRLIPKSFSSFFAYWYGAYPLNMSTHKHLFSTSRVPRKGKDELQTDASSRHLCVVARGVFYRFDVVQENGNMVDPQIILDNFRYIIEISKESSSPTSSSSSSLASSSLPSPSPSFPHDSEPQVGYFTSMERDKWSDVREKLLLLGNTDNIKSIETSIILVSLEHDGEDGEDGKMSDGDGYDTKTPQMGKMFLAGDGANRWFDKSMTLIVRRDGVAGVNFEHSWGDGVAMLRYFQDVYKDSTQTPVVQPSSSSSSSSPSRLVQQLSWKMTSDLEEDLRNAKSHYHHFTASFDLQGLQYSGLSKEFLKQKKLSPDSFMQLAFQIAFKKLYTPSTNQLPTSYESCSTAAFKHGRTETLRPASTQMQQAIQLSKDPSTPPGVFYQAMKECSNNHVLLARQASMGQGFDRHLLGLKAMADPSRLPAIFTHPSYHHINYNILSSSTLSSPAILLGGFAPTAKDAFGIGYYITDNEVKCVIGGYPQHRSLTDYKGVLLETFEKLAGVLRKVEL